MCFAHLRAFRYRWYRAAMVACAVVPSARAATIFVDDSATGPTHNGTSWCSAFLDLQDAFAAAQPGDELQVAAGLYTPDRASGDRLATFRLKSGVRVLGGYAGCGAGDSHARDFTLYETILSGDLSGDDLPNFGNYVDNSFHVVTYSDPAATGVVLEGFTVRGGHADGNDGLSNQGGGIHIRNGLVKCLPGGPTIRNCIVEKNWGRHHGAVNDHGLSTFIENCTIRDNYAGVEGGGLQVHSGAPTVMDCLFENNISGGNGGGAWVGVDADPTCSGAARPRFENCTFSGNRALRGGGLYNAGADVALMGGVFSSNTATAFFPEDRLGGGLYNAAGSTATLAGCALTGNHAFFGGGMYNDAAVVRVDDTTFASNTTPLGGELDASGGQIWPGGGGLYSTAGADLALTGCLLQSNQAMRYGGALYATAGANLTLTDCSLQSNTAVWLGAALYADGDSVIRVSRCAFGGNRSYYGAMYIITAIFLADDCSFSNNSGNYAMILRDSSTRFKNCLFAFNVAENNAGGALNAPSGLHDFVNCRFEGNQAFDRGGAVEFGGGVVRLANCVFRGNSASWGGAISIMHDAWVEVANSTFMDNTALAGASVGIYGNVPPNTATLTVRNSILWDAGGVMDNSVGAVVSIEFSDVRGGWSGLGNLDVDPQLQPDFRLSPDSPCVDAGSTQNLPLDAADLDQDGDTLEALPLDADLKARVLAVTVDMGAYEAAGPAPCQPGTFSATGFSLCDPCPPGSDQPSAGATSCVACSSGTYASSPGTVVCPVCPTLQFQPATGQSACLPCSCDDENDCTTDTCDAVTSVCQNNAVCVIPTVSQWGVLMMAILLAVAGTITIRRVAVVATRAWMFFMALASFALPAQAAQVWYVDHQASGPSLDGTSWCGAFLELRDAIGAAAAGDEIRVANGVYRPDRGAGWMDGDRAATFRMKSGVALMGGFAGCGAVDPDGRDFAGYETVLDGDLSGNDLPSFGNYADNSFHVVTYSDPAGTNAVLDGFTVRGGHADGTGPASLTTNQGSGIHIRNGTVRCIPGGPIIRNCIIRDNKAAHHGAINDHGLGTVIENCQILNNFAAEEGAGLLIHSGPTQVTGCTFTNNVTDKRGGGVWIGHDTDPSCTAPSDPTFTNCTFTANRANFPAGDIDDGGAAIYNQGGLLTLTDCVFTGNLAIAWGGALYNQAASAATITRCTFSANRADRPNAVQSYGSGGAIAHKGAGLLTMTDCSLVENSATTAGALYNFGPANLSNCAFDGNSAGYTGAIRNWKNLKLTRCSFTDNSAQGAGACQFEGFAGAANVVMTNCVFLANRATHGLGGALNNIGGSNLSATNCLFAGNTARLWGAAIHGSANIALSNCTIVGNQITYEGNGAIEVVGPVAIANSIIWGNLDPENRSREIDQIDLNGGAITLEHTCVQGWSGAFGGSGNVGFDPLLMNPAGEDYRLSQASPCRDAAAYAAISPDLADLDNDGDVSEPIPLDLGEQARVYGGGLDMGALEFGPTQCLPGTFSATGAPPCTSCPPGSAQPSAGATQCVACSPGTYAFSLGSAACPSCPTLQFQPSTGQSACLPCSCDDNNGCTTDTCDGVTGVCQNNAFCVVPAVSQWGLFILALLVAVAGTVTIRRVTVVGAWTGVFFTALASFALPVQAAPVRYVDRDAAGVPHDGTSWCRAFLNPQDAIQAASSGDEIRVANGVYRPDRGAGQVPGDRTATLRMKSGVALLGGFAGCGAAAPDARDFVAYETVLDGDLSGNDLPSFGNYADNSFHVVTYSDPAGVGAVLEGFTVRGGHADGTGPASLTTNQGGGIHIRNGTAKCIPGGPTLRNCLIEENRAAHHGAVNDHAWSTQIENCIIRGNYSGEEGGGLQVHSGAPRIVNTLFTDNESATEGGGAWIGADTDPTCFGPARPVFEGCTFSNNRAVIGGGMTARGSAPTFMNAQFTGNSVTIAGGGVWAGQDSAPLFENCVFSDNRAADQGGAVLYTLNEPVFRDCLFVANQAVDRGGGTHGELLSHPIFERCVWDGNSAESAGGFWHMGPNSRITISDGVFRNNRATGATGAGGGLFVYAGSPLVTNTLFENNSAYSGGGVTLQHPIGGCQSEFCDQIFEDCTFRGNTAQFGGGLRGFYFSRPILRRVLFEQNQAEHWGGGMALSGTRSDPELSSIAFLSDCLFRDNSSGGDAGGLHAHEGTTLSLVRTDFVNNSALWFGGGAYVSLDTDVTIVNSRFLGNRITSPGGSGGGLRIAQNVNALIFNTLFAGNISGNSGGGVLIDNGSTVSILNSTLAGNVSPGVGGALYVDSSTLQLANSIVWDNQQGSGGPISTGSSSPSVSYSTVEGGWAGVSNLASDPLFMDPLGGDGVPGTGDEDLRLAQTSPALNTGDSSLLPADVTDLDGDGDSTEPNPLDLDNAARVSGSGLDMGVFEAGPSTCQPAPCDRASNRHLNFWPGGWFPGAADPRIAIRIRMIDLCNPIPRPPPTGPFPNFSPFEWGTCTDPGGCVRWLGPPVTALEYQDSPTRGSWPGSRLQCTPYYHDWTPEGVIRATAAEVIPSSIYYIDVLPISCMGIEDGCPSAAAAPEIRTRRWGDVIAPFNPPSTTTQPDALDVTASVDKFKGLPGALPTYLAQLQPNLVEMNVDVSALDVVQCVDAFKGFAYPFSGPCVCPSTVTCNATACSNPTPCGGGTCVKTCSGGTYDGMPCINNTHCLGGLCGAGFCRDRCGRCTP